jgi:hypothetical protein
LSELRAGSTIGGYFILHQGVPLKVLEALLQVDGAGSGLDADLLDGMSPSTYNTANTIVQRDASGNFLAGTITATLSGNASTANKWYTPRTITVSGAETGTVTIDGSANATLTLTVNHTHSYLPLTGGTITGQITYDSTLDKSISFTESGVEKGRIKVTSIDYMVISCVAGIYLRPNGDGSTTGQLFIPTSGSMTHAGNTIWTSGNDGSGSGLDADLLDGKHLADLTSDSLINALIFGA